MTDPVSLATRLDQATRTATPVPQQSTDGLGLDHAYAVQAAGVDLRIARGDHAVGVKLGFTSQAKRAQMGVDEVILGRLTGRMGFSDGATIDSSTMIHPRVEPEVAFRFASAVSEDAPLDALPALVDGVAPALEVIDSRFQDYRFDLGSVVADNASSCAFAIGPWRRPGDVDVAHSGVLLEVDGVVVETGSTAAIMGNPVRALVKAVELSRRLGIELPAGSIVLAGAATAAVALRPGSFVRAVVGGLGSVSLRVPPVRLEHASGVGP